MLAITESIAKSLNNNQKIVLVSFDLKKAFDCENHKILLTKFKCFCDQKALKLIESYLTNRNSIVKYNKKLSKFHKIETSVPQGDCLAPLLFVIYINDIFDIN